MRLAISAASDTGRKRNANEDSYAVDEKLALFVVADGLGGHVAGRRASQLGVSVVLETVSGDPEGPAPDVLRHAFARANEAILDVAEADAELRGMGTTLAVLWLRGEEAVLAHAGDSRLYLLRAGRLHPLTLDHSLVGERVARGEITDAQARVHPSRHVITRAIGVVPWVEPDVAGLRAKPGDVFVLCSDGISSQITDADIEHCLVGREERLASASEALIRLANAKGGDDNATVILVRVD